MNDPMEFVRARNWNKPDAKGLLAFSLRRATWSMHGPITDEVKVEWVREVLDRWFAPGEAERARWEDWALNPPPPRRCPVVPLFPANPPEGGKGA